MLHESHDCCDPQEEEENVKCKKKQSNELDHFQTVETESKEPVAGRDFQEMKRKGRPDQF